MGEEKFQLEDYTGQNAIEIKTRLEEKYGLVVTIEKREPTDSNKDYDDDEIIGQSLDAGSEMKKGDSLILYTPNVVDTFPDMASEGWSVSDVEAFCNQYGLILVKEEQETNAYPEGTVISQSRTAGSTIIKGTTLRIYVAIKPVVKETPVEDKTTEEPEPTETGSDDENE